MKKKNLSTKLSLKKKTITTLTSGKIKGGDTGPSLYPTEPEGCSNGCPQSRAKWCNTAANCPTVVEIECGLTFMCIETRNPKC